MTCDEVRRRVAAIGAIRGDDEAAHSEEDGLYREVLGAISRGEGDPPAELAFAALATRGLDFERWCA